MSEEFDPNRPAICLYTPCGKKFNTWWGLRSHYQITDHLVSAREDKEDKENGHK